MGLFGKVIEEALESKVWESISKNVIGKIDIRLGDPRIKPSDVSAAKEFLRDPSSIFAFATAELNRPGHMLQSLLFREKYTHAGLVIPEILDPYAARAIHIDIDGFHVEPFIDVLAKCDRFCLVRLPIPSDKLSEAHNRIRAVIARKPEYDTAFKLRDNSKLFCSEIIWEVGQGLIEDPDFKSKWVAGKETFLPDTVPLLGEIVAER